MPHSAQVTHHVPGRIRVKICAGKGNRELLEQIRQAIFPLPGVTEVEVNPITGSVLVHYDPNAHSDFHHQLVHRGESLDLFSLLPPEVAEINQLASAIEREAVLLAAHSETARAIVDGAAKLNEACKRATANVVDLKVLLPLGLAVYTVLKLEIDAATPLWLTLAMFSFSSFVTLHPVDPEPS